MARELDGKVAAVTGAASGIGLASTEAMLAAGARVVMVDRDEAALKALRDKHGDAVIPLLIDLLDPKDCATVLPRVLEQAGQPSISCMRMPGRMSVAIWSMPTPWRSTGC
ncbi:NADP-dependent 3-hydroxy acid dehydrogenase YdfG [Bradyrhizobium sp. GM6.1]